MATAGINATRYIRANPEGTNQFLVERQKIDRELCRTASNLFVTDEIRSERRFGNNLRLYIDKASFEKLYYPDRQRAIKDVAVFWCDHIDKTYVPSLYFVDIHTGERLTSNSCLWRMLQHSKKPTRAPQQPPSYNEDPSLLRPVPERAPIPQDDPSLWHPSPNQ